MLGASTDDAAANAAFRRKFDFPFPLLCDTDHALGVAYGAIVGDAKMAARAAAIIGPDGKIVKWWAKVDAKTFPATALAELP